MPVPEGAALEEVRVDDIVDNSVWCISERWEKECGV